MIWGEDDDDVRVGSAGAMTACFPTYAIFRTYSGVRTPVLRCISGSYVVSLSGTRKAARFVGKSDWGSKILLDCVR